VVGRIVRHHCFRPIARTTAWAGCAGTGGGRVAAGSGLPGGGTTAGVKHCSGAAIRAGGAGGGWAADRAASPAGKHAARGRLAASGEGRPVTALRGVRLRRDACFDAPHAMPVPSFRRTGSPPRQRDTTPRSCKRPRSCRGRGAIGDCAPIRLAQAGPVGRARGPSRGAFLPSCANRIGTADRVEQEGGNLLASPRPADRAIAKIACACWVGARTLRGLAGASGYGNAILLR